MPRCKKLAEGKNLKFSRNLSNAGKFEDVLNSFTDFSQFFRRMEALLAADFAGTLPIVTLNCFKAYKMCLESWRIIALHYGDEEGASLPEELMATAGLKPEKYARNIHSGSFYHLTAAAAVDDRTKKVKDTVSFADCEWPKVMGDAIVKVWGGSKAEDFVWKGV